MHLRDLKTTAQTDHKLAVRAVDGAGNRSAEVTATSESRTECPPAFPARSPVSHRRTAWPAAHWRYGRGDHRRAGQGQSRTGELIPPQAEGYQAANHLWDAGLRRVVLQAARNEFVAFQVMLRGDSTAGPVKAELVFDGPAGKTTTSRVRAVSAGGSRGTDARPDRALDLRQKRRGSKYRSLHIEFYVPHAGGG